MPGEVLQLYPNSTPQPQRANYDFEEEMSRTIDAFEVRAHSANNRGFTSGFTGLDEALEGLQTGFHILAGDSNIGKSSLMSLMAWNVATKNPDAYVLDFSLDDPMHEKIARVVAAANRVIINAVKLPNNYTQYPEMLKRRSTGIQMLRDTVNCYKCYDSSHSTDIDHIEDTIKHHIVKLRFHNINKRIVVFIDNFHDLTTTARESQGSDKVKYDYLAQRVSDMATRYDIPIICTAEFRKLNGHRRPGLDDIREAVKIKYEAKSILLCYNEVGVKGEAAAIYFERNGVNAKQPIFEIKIGKNKFSGSKARLFFEFYPELAYFEESDKDDSKRYNNLIFANS